MLNHFTPMLLNHCFLKTILLKAITWRDFGIQEFGIHIISMLKKHVKVYCTNGCGAPKMQVFVCNGGATQQVQKGSGSFKKKCSSVL